MLKRGWKWMAALCTVSAMLTRMREVWEELLRTDTAMDVILQPPVADTTEKELVHAVQSKAAPEQAPPPAPSMPISHRFVSAGPQPLGGILPAW